ncbi:MAG: DNA-binding HxlR family transcriptional regulator [Paracoccaceae bacterium]
MIGDKWSILILREMFLGGRRFDDFLRLTGMSPHLLSQRLKNMVDAGIVRREEYLKHPPRYEYRLTASGRELWPVVITLKQWGDRWLGDDEMPVEIQHKTCGRTVRPHLICPDCGQPMNAHDAEPHVSPKYENERQAARKHR